MVKIIMNRKERRILEKETNILSKAVNILYKRSNKYLRGEFYDKCINC